MFFCNIFHTKYESQINSPFSFLFFQVVIALLTIQSYKSANPLIYIIISAIKSYLNDGIIQAARRIPAQHESYARQGLIFQSLRRLRPQDQPAPRLQNNRQGPLPILVQPKSSNPIDQTNERPPSSQHQHASGCPPNPPECLYCQ